MKAPEVGIFKQILDGKVRANVFTKGARVLGTSAHAKATLTQCLSYSSYAFKMRKESPLKCTKEGENERPEFRSLLFVKVRVVISIKEQSHTSRPPPRKHSFQIRNCYQKRTGTEAHRTPLMTLTRKSKIATQLQNFLTSFQPSSPSHLRSSHNLLTEYSSPHHFRFFCEKADTHRSPHHPRF